MLIGVLIAILIVATGMKEMDDTDLGLRADPPQVGEHTDAILSEVGYSEDAIADLRHRDCIA